MNKPSRRLSIWLAGVEAVRSDQLVLRQVRSTITGSESSDADSSWMRSGDRRCRRGQGRRRHGRRLEAALGPWLDDKQVTRLDQRAGHCAQTAGAIHLHAARAPGVNEPSAEGVVGGQEILRLVESLAGNDLCCHADFRRRQCLLPLPGGGITLDDKLAVTRLFSARRRHRRAQHGPQAIEPIKGGGASLPRFEMIALVISDILGDPLELIASGPTVSGDAPVRSSRGFRNYPGFPWIAGSPGSPPAPDPPPAPPPGVQQAVFGPGRLHRRRPEGGRQAPALCRLAQDRRDWLPAPRGL